MSNNKGAFHVNSKDEVKSCQATKRACRFSVHEDSEEQLYKIIAENISGSTVKTFKKPKSSRAGSNKSQVDDKVFKPDFSNVLSEKEVIKLIRKDMMYGTSDPYSFFGKDHLTRKQIASLSDEKVKHASITGVFKSFTVDFALSNDNSTPFMQGPCGFYALEAHMQTGLPFIIFTVKDTDTGRFHRNDGGWQGGHIGIKINDKEFFDADGISDISSMKRFMHYELEEETLTIDYLDEYKKWFGLEEDESIKTLTDKTSRYMLGFRVNELLKESGLIKKEELI